MASSSPCLTVLPLRVGLFSIRNVAAEDVQALRCSVVGRRSNPDARKVSTFRDLPLRLVHKAASDPWPPEVGQYIEVLNFRDACIPERLAGLAPVYGHLPGEVFCDEGRANSSLLFRQVALTLRAGLVPAEVAEGCLDRGHFTFFERAYHEVFHLGGTSFTRAEKRLMADSARSDGSPRRRR
jgi:hypothetical protein